MKSAFGVEHGDEFAKKDVVMSSWGPKATKDEKRKLTAKQIAAATAAGGGTMAAMNTTNSKTRIVGAGIAGAGIVGGQYNRHKAIKRGVLNPALGEKKLYGKK